MRKLLHYESLKDGLPAPGKVSPGGSSGKSLIPAAESNSEPTIIKSKSKKKASGSSEKKKMASAIPSVAKEILGTNSVIFLKTQSIALTNKVYL